MRAAWQRCEQPPGKPFTEAEAQAKLTNVWSTYDAPGQADTEEQSDGKPKPNRLTARAYTRAQLAALPAPAELIADTLDLRTLVLLYGPPGSLKSFTVLSWLASIATGKAWLGRSVTRTGRVLYIAAEGAHGIDRRLAAWEAKHSREIADDRLTVISGPVNLLERDQVADLVELAAGYLAVGIDTLSRCTVGGDENSQKDMGHAIDAMGRIRDATGDGVVIAAHHTPRNGETPRGSTVLPGAIDTMYHADGDYRQVTLKRTKRKDGPQDDRLTAAFEPVLLSGVLADKHADMSNRADDLVRVMSAHFATTGCSMADLRKVADMAPATFHRSLDSLVRLGIVQNTGTDKRPFYLLTNRSS
jgi:predicted transcriptional regulator